MHTCAETRARIVVYRSTLDEDRLIDELKKANFDLMMEIISEVNPEFARLIQSIMRQRVKEIILFRKRRIAGKPPLTEEELRALRTPVVQEMVEFLQRIEKQNQVMREFMRK